MAATGATHRGVFADGKPHGWGVATEDGVETSIEWKEPETYESPFIIKPRSRVVKAHSETTFTMVLPAESATGVPGRIASVAVADLSLIHISEPTRPY